MKIFKLVLLSLALHTPIASLTSRKPHLLDSYSVTLSSPSKNTPSLKAQAVLPRVPSFSPSYPKPALVLIVSGTVIVAVTLLLNYNVSGSSSASKATEKAKIDTEKVALLTPSGILLLTEVYQVEKDMTQEERAKYEAACQKAYKIMKLLKMEQPKSPKTEKIKLADVVLGVKEAIRALREKVTAAVSAAQDTAFAAFKAATAQISIKVLEAKNLARELWQISSIKEKQKSQFSLANPQPLNLTGTANGVNTPQS